MTSDVINIYLAGPRGFCAGVERAVLMVEEAIKKYGGPIYVRHEIVHNKYVVEDLKVKGAVLDRKSTRLNSSHKPISYAVFCLKKKNKKHEHLKSDYHYTNSNTQSHINNQMDH